MSEVQVENRRRKLTSGGNRVGRGGGKVPQVSQSRRGGFSRKTTYLNDGADFSVSDGVDFNTEKGQHSTSTSHQTRKVHLQQFTLSCENQELIESVLKDLKGEIENPEQLTKKDHVRTLGQKYWLNDDKLIIEDFTSYSDFTDGIADDSEFTNKYAVQKLQRYGFEKDICQRALKESHDDVGKALESLLKACAEKFVHKDFFKEYDSPFNPKEIMEAREEEKIALEAIFGSSFCEHILNKVWIVTLHLPYLHEYFQKQTPTPNKSSTSKDRSKVCIFYQQGKCRYGRSCKFSHASQHTGPVEKIIVEKQVENEHFELQVRFPDNNCYPFEPPLVCFLAHNDSIPSSVCLKITLYLLRKAYVLAADNNPAVYTLTTLFDDRDSILAVLDGEQIHLNYFSPTIHSQPYTREPESKNEASTENEMAETKQNCQLGKEIFTDTLDNRKSRLQTEKEIQKLKKAFVAKQSNSRYLERQKQRRELPAWQERHIILEELCNHQVIVISGLTGCGKTTQVPQYILDDWLRGNSSSHCLIICTQPRRISAISVAERVAFERSEKLGESVGYQIRMESVQSTQTCLLFCTMGILLRRLEGDPQLSGVTHLLVDEVHERSEESDYLLMVLRDILPQRPDLKLVLMSATLNARLFSEYFGHCSNIEIPGRTFPVKEFFLEDALHMTKYIMEDGSPYMKEQAKGKWKDIDDEREDKYRCGNLDKDSDSNLSVKMLALRYPGCSKNSLETLAAMDLQKINYDLIEAVLDWIVSDEHEYPKGGAILVFLPGMAEITSLYEQLRNHSVFGEKARRFKLLPLHSSLSSEEQSLVFSKMDKGVRKIVLSTNIAETSVTIDDVVYVVDTGMMKEKRYDPSKGMESLDTVRISKANAVQRKGRAGRVQPGVCFHLFTSHHFKNNLRHHPEPEIQRIPLEQIVLRVKLMPIFAKKSVLDVLSSTLEPPPSESVKMAVNRLQELGALDKMEDLTPLGYHIASLPVDVRIGKLMLFGSMFQCLDSALTIAACLSYRSPFKTEFIKREESEKKKKEFSAGKSDQLTALKAYKGWKQACKKGKGYNYCRENFLSINTLQTIASMKHQFVELLATIGFAPKGLTFSHLERMSRKNGDVIMETTGSQFNVHSENLKLVSAILCAALYPNVVQVLTPMVRYASSSGGTVRKDPKPEELRFKTRGDNYVFIHPSSVNFNVGNFESPYLVYHEKVKTSKVYIRECSMVPVQALFLLGGGQLSVEMYKGDLTLSLDDGWVHVKVTSPHVAGLICELKSELSQLLKDKIEDPSIDLCTCPRGHKIITTIMTVLSTE
ncbi:putative ATP-dependent RNA helicase DHX57 [Limulus polyphemus]|uniref:ATP-dependent RNA helicase DHX57 n=1 Tax=Limulus polyphemus TaxID=6850 RepID=A0ABM1BPJ7_LIMPO|nr:putative ATP-dependent RNA helicase DHX57 [Limulus polyphemus]